MLPLRARVDLRAMEIKRYTAFPKAPALLKPHHQIVSCDIQDTHWRSLTLLQRFSRCIQPTEPYWQGSCICSVFRFFGGFFTLHGLPEQNNPPDDAFFYFILITCMYGLQSGICQAVCISKLLEHFVSHFLQEILVNDFTI